MTFYPYTGCDNATVKTKIHLSRFLKNLKQSKGNDPVPKKLLFYIYKTSACCIVTITMQFNKITV